MDNLDKTEIDAVLETISDIDIFLRETGKFHDVQVYPDRTIKFTYFKDGYYVSIRKDANNYPYSIEVHLKEHATLAGVILEEDVIAAPCPFDKIPF